MKFLWLYLTLAAMVAWGLWAFFPRLAADKVPSTSAIAWEWLGSLIIAVPLLLSLRFQPQTGPSWWFLFAVATGVCGFGGALFYYMAMRQAPDKTATVIVISSLYPLVSVGLSVLVLRHRLSALQVLGIVMSMAGAVLLVWASQRTQRG